MRRRVFTYLRAFCVAAASARYDGGTAGPNLESGVIFIFFSDRHAYDASTGSLLRLIFGWHRSGVRVGAVQNNSVLIYLETRRIHRRPALNENLTSEEKSWPIDHDHDPKRAFLLLVTTHSKCTCTHGCMFERVQRVPHTRPPERTVPAQ